MALQVTHRRFTVADYERMVTAGILTEDDRIELVVGEIVETTPIGGRYVQCVNYGGPLCQDTGMSLSYAGCGQVHS